jgi:hypothetical protein
MQGRIRLIAAAELAAMTLLVLSYIWLWPRAFPGAFALCAVGYFGIGFIGHLMRGESLQNIGFRVDNWLPAMRNASYVVAFAVTVALAAGLMLNSWHFPGWKGAVLTLLVTTIWATAQQYGLLCVFYRRFHELLGNVGAAAVGAALFFAIFHVPNSFLMAVTLVAGTAACVLYRYQQNVFVLGIAHALISFTLYYALPPDITARLHVGPGYYRWLETTASEPLIHREGRSHDAHILNSQALQSHQ